MPIEDAGKVLASFATIQMGAASVLEPLVGELQGVLDRLAGQSFGSLEANQAVTRDLVALLYRLGMRVECTRCGEPAVLRCAPMARMKEGAFKFEHLVNGRQTHHRASPVLPALKLVPRPHATRRGNRG